jgi:hypothetical protein
MDILYASAPARVVVVVSDPSKLVRDRTFFFRFVIRSRLGVLRFFLSEERGDSIPRPIQFFFEIASIFSRVMFSHVIFRETAYPTTLFKRQPILRTWTSTITPPNCLSFCGPYF